MRLITSVRYAVVSMAVVVALAGCATSGPAAPSTEELVQQRAQERWDLRLAGNLEAAYEFLSPAQRTAMSLVDYQRQVLMSKIRHQSAVVERAECDEQVCTVYVKLALKLYAAVPGVSEYDLDQTIDERWIRAENQWWFVPE